MLKSVILSLPSYSSTSANSLPDPQRLVARLAKGLDGITNSKARASVYWLVGQYARVEDNKCMGWDGVASWVPDVLRKGVKGFAIEVRKLQRKLGKLLTTAHFGKAANPYSHYQTLNNITGGNATTSRLAVPIHFGEI